MNRNFKPGDLAIVVASTQIPEIVSMCVELLVRVERDERIDFEGYRWFSVNSPVAWVVRGRGILCMTAAGDIVDRNGLSMIGEHRLMPLRGDFAPERQQDQQDQQEPQSKYELLDDLEAGMDVRGLPV